MIGDFWAIISVQAITFFLLYFAPTPGGEWGSGVEYRNFDDPFYTRCWYYELHDLAQIIFIDTASYCRCICSIERIEASF